MENFIVIIARSATCSDHSKISNLSVNDIINETVRDPKNKFCVGKLKLKIVGYLACSGCLRCIKTPLYLNFQ